MPSAAARPAVRANSGPGWRGRGGLKKGAWATSSEVGRPDAAGCLLLYAPGPGVSFSGSGSCAGWKSEDGAAAGQMQVRRGVLECWGQQRKWETRW